MITQKERDIIDKLNGFEISGKRVSIKTKHYRFKGIIRFVTPERGIVNILDDKEGFSDINLNTIQSDKDIQEATY